MKRTGVGTWIGFAAILIWCLLPVAWIISLSFKPVSETTVGSPQFLPKTWTIQNYKDIIANPDFTRALLNSFLFSAMFTVVALVGPLFDPLPSIGLFITWKGLILPFMPFTLP